MLLHFIPVVARALHSGGQAEGQAARACREQVVMSPQGRDQSVGSRVFYMASSQDTDAQVAPKAHGPQQEA